MNELEKLKYELIECCIEYPRMIKEKIITGKNASWGIQKIIDQIKEYEKTTSKT